jgi:hypothetical protein
MRGNPEEDVILYMQKRSYISLQPDETESTLSSQIFDRRTRESGRIALAPGKHKSVQIGQCCVTMMAQIIG